MTNEIVPIDRSHGATKSPNQWTNELEKRDSNENLQLLALRNETRKTVNSQLFFAA